MHKIKLNYKILNNTLDSTSNPNPWVVGYRHQHDFCKNTLYDLHHHQLLSAQQLFIQWLFNLNNHGVLVNHFNNTYYLTFYFFSDIKSQIIIKFKHDHWLVYDNGNTLKQIQRKYVVMPDAMTRIISKATAHSSNFHDVYSNDKTYQLYSPVNNDISRFLIIPHAVYSFLDLYADVSVISYYFHVQFTALMKQK